LKPEAGAEGMRSGFLFSAAYSLSFRFALPDSSDGFPAAVIMPGTKCPSGEPVLDGPYGGLGAIVQLHLAEQILHVLFHGFDADLEGVTDLPV